MPTLVRMDTQNHADGVLANFALFRQLFKIRTDL